MSRLYRHGFPIFASIFMGSLFMSGNIYIQSAVVAFAFWGMMDIAGQIHYD